MLVADVSTIGGENDLSSVSKQKGILSTVVDNSDVIANSFTIAIRYKNIAFRDSIFLSPIFASFFPNQAPESVERREDEQVVNISDFVSMMLGKNVERGMEAGPGSGVPDMTVFEVESDYVERSVW